MNGTKIELSGFMKSMFPEYAVAITGLPSDIASAIVKPYPSLRCNEIYV